MHVTIADRIGDPKDVVCHVEERIRDWCRLSREERGEQRVEIGPSGVVEGAGQPCIAVVHARNAETGRRETLGELVTQLDVPDLLTDPAYEDDERRACRTKTVVMEVQIALGCFQLRRPFETRRWHRAGRVLLPDAVRSKTDPWLPILMLD